MASKKFKIEVSERNEKTPCASIRGKRVSFGEKKSFCYEIVKPRLATRKAKVRILNDFCSSVSGLQFDKDYRYKYSNYGTALHAFYKDFSEKTGWWPKKAVSAWNSVMWKTWIQDNQSLISKLAFRQSGVFFPLLEKVHKHLELLKQTEKDGLDNLLPLILASGKSPKELKERFGNKNWKQLANSSFSFNKQFSNSFFEGERAIIKDYRDVEIFPSISFYADRNIHAIEKDVKYCLFNTLKSERKLSKRGFCRDYLDTIRDCKRMAEQEGLPFNKKWSKRRIDEEHDRMVDIINYKKKIHEPLKSPCPWLLDEIESENFKAILLKSSEEISKEGKDMKHCVSSYTHLVSTGQCGIYSIQYINQKGKKISTLQIVSRRYKFQGQECWEFSLGQHYGPCNKSIQNEEVLQLAKKVLANINNGYLKATKEKNQL